MIKIFNMQNKIVLFNQLFFIFFFLFAFNLMDPFSFMYFYFKLIFIFLMVHHRLPVNVFVHDFTRGPLKFEVVLIRVIFSIIPHLFNS
jgi:hypothetical protein